MWWATIFAVLYGFVNAMNGDLSLWTTLPVASYVIGGAVGSRLFPRRAKWAANLFWRYQKGEMTRREYLDEAAGPVPWRWVAFALAIPAVTLLVWLLLRA